MGIEGPTGATGPRPEVSVVVPAYGVAGLVTRQLDALAPQVVACGGEIVVVDDASPDATGAVAATWSRGHPEARCSVLRARVRRFSSASRNAGIRFARADFLVCTDGDDAVRPGWLGAMVAASGPGTLVAGRFVTAGDPEPRGLLPFYRLTQGVALGSTMGFARSVFDAVGGFDEAFRYGGDDIEFFLTAQLAHGAGFREAPAAVIEYRVPTDRRGRRRRNCSFQRGSALVARRVRALPDAPDPGFRLRARVHDAAAAAVRTVTGGGRGRAEESDRLRVEATAAWWIARFAVACPRPQRTDVAIDPPVGAPTDAHYELLHDGR